MKTLLKKFCRDEDGASMVEYGLALLVVTGIGVGAMNALGTNTGTIVTGACDVIAAGVETPEACTD